MEYVEAGTNESSQVMWPLSNIISFEIFYCHFYYCCQQLPPCVSLFRSLLFFIVLHGKVPLLIYYNNYITYGSLLLLHTFLIAVKETINENVLFL